ncbi:hypothetical protein OpiT1DRAFT_00585 [Opitutaceae bacterium TAV1]|nr:hypothetical protein OpiT1DRAFT_00585 [Opitutaceae bacterium TAV1]
MDERSTIDYILAAVVALGAIAYFIYTQKRKATLLTFPVSAGTDKNLENDLKVELTELHQQAIDLAKASGTILDESKQSIKALDELLAKLHSDYKNGSLTDKQVNRAATAFGAYVGTLFTRYEGGAWFLSTAPGTNSPMPAIQFGEFGEAWPMLKVKKAIVNGPEDAILPYIVAMQRNQKKDNGA